MGIGYLKGFASLFSEVSDHTLTPCDEKNTAPAWLKGSFVHNGPGRYDLSHYKLRHWFDGMSMLHKIRFQDGRVCYSNRMLQSKAWQAAYNKGELAYREFGSLPHSSLIRDIRNLLSPAFSDNTNVNIGVVDNHYLAFTDTPVASEFDLQTLDTVSNFHYNDKLVSILSTPHPHYDANYSVIYNYCTSLARPLPKYAIYNLYRISGSTTRQVFGTYKVDRPAYMHSFAMTENYIILVEFPLYVSQFMKMLFNHRPALENLSWQPAKGSRFLAFSKKDGTLKQTWQGEAFFAFHHINAYELNGDILLDIVAYPHQEVLTDMLFDHLLRADGGDTTIGEYRRYHLQANADDADYETIAQLPLEMPRINYGEFNARPYKYFYGVSRRTTFYDELVKVNTETRQVEHFYPNEVYANNGEYYVGEPLFVARPGAQTEDDGVVLILIMNATKDISFLSILDAQNFGHEIARYNLPFLIPNGLHSQFFDQMGRLVSAQTKK